MYSSDWPLAVSHVVCSRYRWVHYQRTKDSLLKCWTALRNEGVRSGLRCDAWVRFCQMAMCSRHLKQSKSHRAKLVHSKHKITEAFEFLSVETHADLMQLMSSTHMTTHRQQEVLVQTACCRKIQVRCKPPIRTSNGSVGDVARHLVKEEGIPCIQERSGDAVASEALQQSYSHCGLGVQALQPPLGFTRGCRCIGAGHQRRRAVHTHTASIRGAAVCQRCPNVPSTGAQRPSVVTEGGR